MNLNIDSEIIGWMILCENVLADSWNSKEDEEAFAYLQ